MRINPIPFVFAPGISAIGYLVGDMTGVAVALGSWTAITCGATAFVVYRRARTRFQGSR